MVIDCPDPAALAAFYSEVLGLPVTYRSDDWVVIADNATTSGFAFQLAPDHQPPAWPDPPNSSISMSWSTTSAWPSLSCWPSARGGCRRETTCMPTPPATPSVS